MNLLDYLDVGQIVPVLQRQRLEEHNLLDRRATAAFVRFIKKLFDFPEVYDLGDVVEHNNLIALGLVFDHSKGRLHSFIDLCVVFCL